MVSDSVGSIIRVPGTGQLYSLGQRACLQADDAGVLTTAPCAEVAPPELDVDGDVVAAPPSPQSWGHHPSGYFMHLATGRCLNLAQHVSMPANAQMKTTPGVGVVLAPCDLASVGYLEAGAYYLGGFGLSQANVLDSDLGEDVCRVVPTTSTGPGAASLTPGVSSSESAGSMHCAA